MNRVDEVRIAAHHLQRDAVVYVRQSSPEQVRRNTESARVQLDLRERAIALGWSHPKVIQDDLGLSASGFVQRPGFQSLLARVALRELGIILCLDASRLSRNSKDWAQLFELCGFFDTLIADLDQVYDLRVPNDRLILGIKGTVSELELSILRNRLRSAIEHKAARGELKMHLPPGYVHDGEGHIVPDPDQRVRDAIQLMFDQFDRTRSVHQLALWYRDTHTSFPVRRIGCSDPTRWGIPTARNLLHLLTHPIYAGVYTFGRSTTNVKYVNGSLVKRAGGRLPPDQARVFIEDHHSAYISRERFRCNGRRIAENRPRWPMLDHPGPIRDGLALLHGLLRCGHCSRRLYVNYKRRSALYRCRGATQGNTRLCLAFAASVIDAAVAAEVCRALSPVAIDAAMVAEDQFQQQEEQEIHNAGLRVEAAKYQVDRAFEQYDAIDPRNRLVADTLEERLNGRLQQLDDARSHLESVRSRRRTLTDEQRLRLHTLAEDFPRAWNHPAANATLKKRILRTVLEEVLVTHDREQQELRVLLHWKGGVHTELRVPKKSWVRGRKTDPSVVDLVQQLARTLPDADIARILNIKAFTTPTGLRWTQSRVAELRANHHIRVAPPRDPELFTCEQAMSYLGVSRNTLRALIERGVLHNRQVTEYAPWQIAKSELDSKPLRDLISCLRATGRLPKGGSPTSQLRLFDENKGLTPEG
ncbi:MAG: recombinase family protein [Planctomycetes bacterium]|nr:recombinase family protein [Planctomycetota bacterium]